MAVIKRVFMYILAFAAGFALLLFPSLMDRDIITLFVLGLTFGFIYPQGSWRIGIPVVLPFFLIVGPFNFSDNAKPLLSTILALHFPLFSCGSAYLGARLALKIKQMEKNRIPRANKWFSMKVIFMLAVIIITLFVLGMIIAAGIKIVGAIRCKNIREQLNIKTDKLHRRCETDGDCRLRGCSVCLNKESMTDKLEQLYRKAINAGCIPDVMIQCRPFVCKCENNICTAESVK